MKKTCAATMAMLANYILLITNPQRPDKEPPKYGSKIYQVFGFDVLFDKNLKAWLLEINAGPSFSAISCKSGVPMGCRHENCPVSVVDMHTKC